MTDTQTMIREVCEALGKSIFMFQCDWHIQAKNAPARPFRPHADYNDTHQLIDWMLEAGWQSSHRTNKHGTTFRFDKPDLPFNELGPPTFTHSGPDFKIAVLTAAWRALKDAV